MLVTLQPTKEQVRAYMQHRQRGCRSSPPPMPEEIRRLLGWHRTGNPPEHFSFSTFFLPGTIAQLATVLAVEWCFLASGVGRPSDLYID
jgi:hypothetical protein